MTLLFTWRTEGEFSVGLYITTCIIVMDIPYSQRVFHTQDMLGAILPHFYAIDVVMSEGLRRM